jgi:putative ABC transport system ATP-binding protein
MTLLKLERVCKSYSSGGAPAIHPLRDVDLELPPAGRMILLGKSGSGKSTFLNLVAGVDSPTSGRIFFEGEEITALPGSALAQYRREKVGFIFQAFNLFPTLTVGENVMLPLELLRRADRKKAEETLAAVGLDGFWKKYPEQLSGGEQQRVGIARALVKDPQLILADEPTGNLDLETGNVILEFIDRVCREKSAGLIMVTHSPDALRPDQSVYRLKGGRLIAEKPAGL